VIVVGVRTQRIQEPARTAAPSEVTALAILETTRTQKTFFDDSFR